MGAGASSGLPPPPGSPGFGRGGPDTPFGGGYGSPGSRYAPYGGGSPGFSPGYNDGLGGMGGGNADGMGMEGGMNDDGVDSEIEAEQNERHTRRPKPAEGPVERNTDGGFLARQPCRVAIFAPTAYQTRHDAHEKPGNTLRLDHVYGYRAHDARHNVCYNLEGMVVYHAAAVGIVYDSELHSQQHFLQHTDDIVCMAMHPDRDIVATGQVGKDPTICVWRSTTRELLAELKGFHQRAVVSLCFDATGKYLGSVGLDDEHSVAVYEWGARKMVANSKGDESRLFTCAYNPYDGRLVTGGVRHLKFWVMEGGYLVGRPAVWGRFGAPCTVLSIAFLPDGTTLTGVQGGAIYQWEEAGEQCLDRYDSIHQGPVHDIWTTDEYTITGGKDGKVRFFTTSMEEVFTIDMAKVAEAMTDSQGKPLAFYDARSPCIKAICMEGARLLVGTKNCEIHEFDMSTEDSWKTNRKLITQGHVVSYDRARFKANGELWGLAVHPFAPTFMTAGDDKTVRVWDMQERVMVSSRNLPSRARCCAYSPDGKQSVVGLHRGGFLVYDTATGNLLASKKHRREEISQIKYSPDGRWLAVGSHDNFVDMYDVLRNFKRIGVCKGHSSYITHLDWSDDSNLLQTNSGDYELLYWEVPSCEQVKFSSALKDVHWATWTCTLGWPVQGIWPKHADGTDLSACDRSHTDESAVVVADDFGSIKLFRYPSDVGRADYHGYQGHANHVTNVRFSYNDMYVISTGGGDRCVLQWRHFVADEVDEEMTSDVEEEVIDAMDNYESSNISNQTLQMCLTGYDNGAPVFTPLQAINAKPRLDIPRDTGLDPNSQLAFWPCAPQVFAPDGYEREPDALAPPLENLELEFVYGVRAHDARANAFFNAKGEIVYHTSSTAVCYNKESNTQRFLIDDPAQRSPSGHKDDIVCMARHPSGSIFATGEVAKSPRVLVWSTEDMRRPLIVLQGLLKRTVVSVTFSRDGHLLAAIGADVDFTLALYRWQTGALLASSPVSRDKVVQVRWSPFQDYMVTLGVKHLAFWSTEPLKSKAAVFSRRGHVQTTLCAAFPSPDSTVVGTQDGSLYLFRGYQLATNMRKCHEVTQAVHATEDMVISGGKEGTVKFWASDLSQCYREVEIGNPQALGSCIKTLFSRDDLLLIGMRTSEVYEMDLTSHSYALVLQGHAYGDVWGLATHPSEHQFVTCGDDGTVRMWDVPSRRMIMIRDLGAKGRSCTYHPDGSQIAIGLVSGGVAILSSDSLDTIHTKRDREEPIHELKYSPNGLYLAAGSYDNYVDIYDISRHYGRVGVCKGHGSFIRHLDWSSDSTVLQTNSGDFDLMFWEVPSGKAIKYASDTRNLDWSTWTAVAGWPVQGVWPAHTTGMDVNSADRSHTRTCVATGDDYGVVSLYPYPAHAGCARKQYGGHSNAVVCARFLFDDSALVTIGGSDQTICQFRVLM